MSRADSGSAISPSAIAATIGSWSTYTTRASGATLSTTSWVLPAAGRPQPMSMNWRMPWAAMNSAARWWKPRFDQAMSDSSGMISRSLSAAIRSTSKLFSPPR